MFCFKTLIYGLNEMTIKNSRSVKIDYISVRKESFKSSLRFERKKKCNNNK